VINSSKFQKWYLDEVFLLKLLNKFKKESPSLPVRKHLQALLDPVEPLVVTAYPKRSGRPKALTDAHIIQIMRWKAAGINNCEIGRRLHVSETTVRRYLRSLQPPARQPDPVLDLTPEETGEPGK